MTGQVSLSGNPEHILKQKLGRIHGGRVLDVATGHGDFALLLAHVFADYEEITGIDTNRKELEVAREAAARQSLTRLRFLTMDAYNLTFPDAAFDTAAVSNSLHHLPDPGLVLAGMMLTLRPGGLFIIREMYCDGLNDAQESHLLFHHLRSDIDTANGIYHRHSYPRKELTEMYRALDLETLDLFDLGPGDDDPLDTEAPEHLVKMLDTWLQAAATTAGLSRRIEAVKEHIRRHGFLPASSLVCIGRNPENRHEE